MKLLNNFWYSYSNILFRSILKKNYFTFLRKIFGTLFKFSRKSFSHIFSSKIVNLDKINKKKLSKLKLDELFINFNCDKGSYCFYDGVKINTHKYSVFYEKYLNKIKKKKLNILELGSHEGRGIASFYYFFPNANFFGANINPFQMKYSSKRINELYVDVSSKKILSNIYISSFSALIKNISFRPRIKKIFYNSTKATDITEQIKKLSELKEIGALTDDEFDAKKKELLDRI